MKIPYKYFIDNIASKPSKEELSEKFFHLGHEHEVNKDMFEMELTPNRGDCISLLGLLRELKFFYDVKIKKDIYEDDIKTFPFEFLNNAKEYCKNISFLKVEIESPPLKYNETLESYFNNLQLNKNNFFTDISNFISYETGQPTHCYDSSKIKGPIKLDFLDKKVSFNTLLDTVIDIQENDLVFLDKNNEVINLAGIIGGKNTACDKNTTSVIIECAYFDPESIMGKSVNYGVNSDAAHKFERNVDPDSHDYVLRRLLKVIEDNAVINNVEIFSKRFGQSKLKSCKYDVSSINKILGTNIDNNLAKDYLLRFGFIFDEDTIVAPSYRNDISNINDISEEIARAIGYDNVKPKSFDIACKKNSIDNFDESKVKQMLINSGFFEVINDPFVPKETNDNLVRVDNPLDSNRQYLRTNLKQSLISNLEYNERRQKESIKLFEVSDIYTKHSISPKRVIGIIASGRVGKNYINFSKKIDEDYLKNIFKNFNLDHITYQEIPRELVNSKSKSTIIYAELFIDDNLNIDYQSDENVLFDIHDKHYEPISEYPSSNRDLSFSIKDFKNCKVLEKTMLNFKHNLLKEVFVFDYYKNEKLKEIKIGIRFVFQSKDSTLTVEDINEVMDYIIIEALNIDTVTIPGLE